MKKGRLIVGVLLFLSLLALCVWLLSRRNTGPESVSGTIEIDQAHLASRYGGRVESIPVQEGDVLKPGDLIVQLDARELRARRDQAAAALEESEHGPRPAEIAAASNDWQALVAQLDFARAEDKRTEELFVQRVVSTTERDNAASRAKDLAQSVAAARERYKLLQEGTRPERIAQARAQLAELDAELGETRVLAPANCTLEVLSVKTGDVLPANQEVATVLLTRQLWVRVYVPETWLGLIHLGQTVRVRVDSFPDKDFEGTVEQLNRQAEFTPRNVQTVDDRIRQVFGVKVRLPTEDGLLRAGMSADVFFPSVPAPPK